MLLPVVVESLQQIRTWSNAGNTRSLLKNVDFEFVMALYVMSSVLEVTKVLSLKLQAVSNDILECHAHIDVSDDILKTI